MASHNTKREQRKKTLVRIIAVVACAALLLTAILPVLAQSLFAY